LPETIAEQEAHSWLRSAEDCGRLMATGESADLIRERCWDDTALGRIEAWDPALLTALDIILASRFPMFLTWGEDHKLFYNDAYRPILMGKGDCLGRPFSAVFPEAWSTLKADFSRAGAGEAIYREDLEVPLLRNMRLSRTWWSFSYSPVRSSKGDIQGVLGVLYETTRRLLAEQTMWHSQAGMRTVTDLAPAMLWRCAPDGRILWANQMFETYVGETSEAHRFQDLVADEDQPAAAEARIRADEERLPFEGQFRLRRADGIYRWFLVRAKQNWDSDGLLVEWCGSAVDIEDWHGAAAVAGQEDREILQAMSGTQQALLWTADLATHELAGLSPDLQAPWAASLVGNGLRWDDWLDNTHAEDRARVAAAFERAGWGEIIQEKFRMSEGEGVWRRYRVTAFPIVSEEGEVRRIGGMLVDISREAEPRLYLIQSDPAEQNRMAHALGKAGFKVRPFDDLRAFSLVSDDLMPGVVLIASSAKDQNLLQAANTLRLNGPRLPWIATGVSRNQLTLVVQLMRLGAADVLPQDVGVETLADAAREALPPHALLSERQGRAPRKIAELSRREREVLEGLAAGGTNKTIAIALSLSPRTVETYRAQLMDRLGARTLAELLKVAAEAGFVDGY